MQKSTMGQSALDSKYREMDYERHVKKITAILESKKGKLTENQIAEFKESFMNAKSVNIRFNDINRQHQINQQNEAMLCKLIEISQGKSCFLNQPQFAGTEQTPSAQQQKPLHLPYRQEKLRQIDEENKALARRLVDQKSFINRNKQQKEISQYEKLKRHMQKFKSVGHISQKPIKLPPILNRQTVFTGNLEQNASLVYEAKTTSHHLQKSHKKIVQDFFADDKGTSSTKNFESSRFRSSYEESPYKYGSIDSSYIYKPEKKSVFENNKSQAESSQQNKTEQEKSQVNNEEKHTEKKKHETPEQEHEKNEQKNEHHSKEKEHENQHNNKEKNEHHKNEQNEHHQTKEQKEHHEKKEQQEHHEKKEQQEHHEKKEQQEHHEKKEQQEHKAKEDHETKKEEENKNHEKGEQQQHEQEKEHKQENPSS